MRKAICDFCPKLNPRQETIPHNCSLPKDWLDFRILAKGRAISFDRLMCPSCLEERNIKIKELIPTVLSDALLGELADGIRDIVQDEMGA